jgi:hypothetical protein
MKEGYSKKGYTGYQGAPLDSASHGERAKNKGAAKAAARVGMQNTDANCEYDRGEGESKAKKG